MPPETPLPKYNSEDEYWTVIIDNKCCKCATICDAEALTALESLLESFADGTLKQGEIDLIRHTVRMHKEHELDTPGSRRLTEILYILEDFSLNNEDKE